MKSMKKACALTLLTGTLFAGGCLGGILNPQQLLYGAALYAINEFVLDNDAVFDLFEDGNVAAQQ
ncbi:MAG: hypothetical protein J5J06_11380 [Phycisphaerae bacterium]|nr:hypothetical protein [Phycisphaerae bacterium]